MTETEREPLEDLTPIRFTALLAREIGGFRKPSGYDGA